MCSPIRKIYLLVLTPSTSTSDSIRIMHCTGIQRKKKCDSAKDNLFPKGYNYNPFSWGAKRKSFQQRKHFFRSSREVLSKFFGWVNWAETRFSPQSMPDSSASSIWISSETQIINQIQIQLGKKDLGGRLAISKWNKTPTRTGTRIKTKPNRTRGIVQYEMQPPLLLRETDRSRDTNHSWPSALELFWLNRQNRRAVLLWCTVGQNGSPFARTL